MKILVLKIELYKILYNGLENNKIKDLKKLPNHSLLKNIKNGLGELFQSLPKLLIN